MPESKIKSLAGKYSDFSGIVLKAAARGDIPAVEHYLKVNPDWLNREGPHGRTMLWEAAYKGRLDCVRELIERGADIDPLGCYYTPMLVDLSPLAVARAAGRLELAALLEHHGATDDIYAACHRGDLAAVTAFLKADKKAVNRPAKDDPDHHRMGFHPVHYAVAGKQLEAFKLLLKHKASIQDHLVLLVDWAEGDPQLVRFIRSQARGPIKRPQTAAQKKAAANQKARGRVRAIDRPNCQGYPPIVEACRGNHNAPDHPERMQELLDKGANVNVVDYKSKTPLHRACQAGFIKITKLLLKHGATPNLADDKGCTPVFDAAYQGRTATVELMIKHKANLSHENQQGETVLFYAARQSHEETMKILLKAGCDPQHVNTRSKCIVDVMNAKPSNPERKRIIRILNKAIKQKSETL